MPARACVRAFGVLFIKQCAHTITYRFKSKMNVRSVQSPSPKQQQPQQRKKLLSDGRLHEKKNGVSETSEGLPMLYALFETKRQLEMWHHEINEGRERLCCVSQREREREVFAAGGTRERETTAMLRVQCDLCKGAVLCWEGPDEFEAAGWAWGTVLNNGEQRGWIPQRLLATR